MKTRALLVALALCGCTVGPDFRTPDPPATERYEPGPPPALTLVPREVSAQWWTAFGSPQLDALVERALRGSPTIDQARARLVQARELRAARAGATTYPKVDLTAGAVRQRIDPATFGFPQAPNPGPFNVFSLGVDASYDFDIFGGSRRELESLAADVDYRSYELEAARLTLATNVVAAAIRRAALADQVTLTEAVLAARRKELAITTARLEQGGVAQVAVETQALLVAQAEAALPSLRAEHARAGHEIAVLMGEPPATAEIPPMRLTDLTLPADLPVRLPSELVRQRPDIRASEALLHKASAQVGVATADLYPKLVVSGGFSSSQLNIGDVLGNGINLWNLGINLLQPVFRGGELQARKRASEAAFDQAAAAYRQSVLSGLQNVADVLRALEADGHAVAARSEQARRAGETYRITLARFRAGGVSELAVVDADRERLGAEGDRLQAEAARYADTAALFQALGGGWRREGDAPPGAASIPGR